MEDEELITNTTLLGELKAGDHIACSRLGGIFEHHGIYMGFVDGFHKVIHVKAPVKSLSSMLSGALSSSDKDYCSICGFKPPKDGGRVTSCLRCFSNGKRMYIIRYKVPLPPYTPNGEVDDLKIGKILRGYRSKKVYLELYKGCELVGHMIIPHNHEKLGAADNLVLISKYASSRSPDEILQVAQSNYDVGKYNFVLNNCEHFIVYCITGEEQSIQAEKKIPKLLYNVAKKAYEPFTNKGKEKMKEKASKKYLMIFSWFENVKF